ncbi:hydrogenase expression/formation protein HypE [Tepidibacillus decaturensis]|uniref:Hydrogenase expression/formation protein HypE n=1 Tax=Tepidibacillus decaturensis TaxID=1413211 RepID=A0A135L605_9BACI|nr:hydrogenase expression/formation protein HypE [Tepidibacillus decaturensis]KXG44438.1 hydrogenase expression/formation protein HypE [Tepidibacillus decaturensis]
MNDRISLAHGDGGELAHQLIQEVFVDTFGHQEQAKLDAAILSIAHSRIAISTDSFVIKPLFFPGGDIGKLAVTGTVNDLAVSGATPKFLTASFIIEEGFPIVDLKKIVQSMVEEAKKADVRIVAGDTKVVEKGSADGLYINTTGIGWIDEHHTVKPESMQEGDSIVISGTIGDHGIAILSARGDLGIQTEVQSDCVTLNHMIAEVLQAVNHVRIMRDPTRGGLATTLVEICEDFNVTMEIDEMLLPVRREVQGACDILGYEPFYLANEGKVIIIVGKEDEGKVLSILHQYEIGKEAKVIGKVIGKGKGKGKGRLFLRTPLGSTRRLDRLSGMLLPRIC